MKQYDPNRPLIAIHVPKTAGISARGAFENWFAGNFHQHYYDEVAAQLPPRLNLKANKGGSPLCIFGHFNMNRGFGIPDYYPEVDQFVTILRDPLEMMVSNYFYMRKVGTNWKDQSRVPTQDLEDFLKSCTINMLNHFPVKISDDNYRGVIDQYFVHIGFTENLDRSLKEIAAKLGVRDPEIIERKNVTPRDQEASQSVKADFRRRHPLEYSVYDYAMAKFG